MTEYLLTLESPKLQKGNELCGVECSYNILFNASLYRAKFILS